MSAHGQITGCPVTDRDLHEIAVAHGFALPDGDRVLSAICGEPDYRCCMSMHLARAACSVPLRALWMLESQGVPVDFAQSLINGFALGVARISSGKSGTWEFDGPDGRLILAVREDGELVDLVAMQSTDADSWALHRRAGWVLGHEQLRQVQIMGAGPLRLFSTPMAWLAARGQGICVLDWTQGAIGALRGLGPEVTLIADTSAAAEALATMLRWRGLPGVECFKNKDRVAA